MGQSRMSQPALRLIAAEWQAHSPGQAAASWTVLDTGFGAATLFLPLLQHWRTQPLAPAMLHYVGVLSAAQAAALPTHLAAAGEAGLAGHCHDLEPGFHRLLLEDGRVSLTLCVGETFTLLGQQQMQADSLLLASPAQPWDKWQLKAVARCCKRGARVVFSGPLLPASALLDQAGFELHADAVAVAGADPVAGSGSG